MTRRFARPIAVRIGRSDCGSPVPDLAREPGAEHEVVEVRAGDEERRRAAPFTASTQSNRVEVVSNACARAAITTPVRIATPSDDQPIGRQRSPNVAQRARALLALEPLHRRHRDEDERDRPADPDGRGEQVHDAESRVHARGVSRRCVSGGLGPADRRARRCEPARRRAASTVPREGAAPRRLRRRADGAPAAADRALQHVGARARSRDAPAPRAPCSSRVRDTSRERQRERVVGELRGCRRR